MVYFPLYFVLQTGSSFLTIETKEEKADTDDGDSNSDSDSVDEGVNKYLITSISSQQKRIVQWAHFSLTLI